MTEALIQESPASPFRGVNFKGEYSLPQDALFQSWSPFGGSLPQDPVLEKYHHLKSELDMKIEEIETRERLLEQKQKEMDELFRKREEDLARREAQEEAHRTELSTLITEIVSKIQSGQKEIWSGNAREMASFSLRLVEHLVGKISGEDPECLIRQIESCVEEAYEEDLIAVHLCPDDLEKLNACENADFRKLLADRRIKWIGDLQLGRGEVLVDAKQYRMDASIQTLLKNVRNDMMAGLQTNEQGEDK